MALSGVWLIDPNWIEARIVKCKYPQLSVLSLILYVPLSTGGALGSCTEAFLELCWPCLEELGRGSD